jgi:hypothetical protein
VLGLFSKLGPEDPSLTEALQQNLEAVSRGARGDRTLVPRVEAEVSAAPDRHIQFDEAGLATLRAAGKSFRAGRFSTPTLGGLRSQALRNVGAVDARVHFWILDGASPATDIGALQAHAPEGALFQVASQFNCLEAPDACVTPVASYFSDPTQGPRASISAFPGTMLRHYAAPAQNGGRFVQTTAGRQLDLLADVSVGAEVVSGYLLTDQIREPEKFAACLEQRHDDIRVGVHDDIEVVFGRDGPVPGAPELQIAQVLTSSVAAGGYSSLRGGDPAMKTIVTQLQRAAHLGALLAAAALDKSVVCLTLIGGGVFGNPHDVCSRTCVEISPSCSTATAWAARRHQRILGTGPPGEGVRWCLSDRTPSL